jgi:hypothetical protein
LSGSNVVSPLGKQQGGYSVKAKTDVKAGFSWGVTNIAVNVSIIHQKGYGNFAYVSQYAAATSR